MTTTNDFVKIIRPAYIRRDVIDFLRGLPDTDITPAWV